ncbi:helix-turn-helix domain-containing protein [Burkholderia sola]
MKPWTWRHAILNSNLPSTTRHVLLTLSCHVNDAGEDAYPSTKTLARESGLSEKSVCTHLGIAREAGWFIVKKHGYGGQKWARNQYYPRIPEGLEIHDSDRQGAESYSVPSKPAARKKALNYAQQLVDKVTEPPSAPSEKALKVVPKGTERDGEKALNDVQSNTAANPAMNAAARLGEQPAAVAAQKMGSDKSERELELIDLLVNLERRRGKTLTIDPAKDRLHLLTWIGKNLTDLQLRDAHKAAVAARKRDSDDRPTYIGFVATFVASAQTPQAAPTASDEDWYLTPEGCDAKGAELNVPSRKPDEPWQRHRVIVAAAARDPRAIEFVLKDAQRFNAVALYQFARATFGDALMPVDDYAS